MPPSSLCPSPLLVWTCMWPDFTPPEITLWCNTSTTLSLFFGQERSVAAVRSPSPVPCYLQSSKALQPLTLNSSLSVQNGTASSLTPISPTLYTFLVRQWATSLLKQVHHSAGHCHSSKRLLLLCTVTLRGGSLCCALSL